MKEKVFYSIDLKSFYAACECINLDLDPYITPLVVANKHQGNGAITLAITPFLKNLGVQSRCRLYEIPRHINYRIENPKMELYDDFKKKVLDVYKSFVDESDIHVYSIDECFLDVTSYLKYYNKSEIQLALDILNEVKEKTGLTATCGIGNSIFLAKVAMDTEAKNNNTNIAFWNNDDIENKLWKIKNLQSVWKIGPSLNKKLNNLGIYTGYDLAHYNKDTLKQKLGIIGEITWDNFNGIYKDSIKSLNEEPKEKSLSQSKYLLKDYEIDEIMPIIIKMADSLENKLINSNQTFETITCKLTYSNNFSSIHSTNKTSTTNKAHIIIEAFQKLIKDNHITDPIRKIDVHLSKINEKKTIQLSLFEESIKNDNLSNAVYDIKQKYGYESITKAINKD